MIVHRLVVPALFCLCCAHLLLPAAHAQDPARIETTLKEHGVPTDSQGVARFLEKGWRAARPPRDLPVNPHDKVSLLIDSWILLTLRYVDVQLDGPPLTGPLAALSLAYAQGKFPPAIEEMLDQDVAPLTTADRKTRRAALAALLRSNGMVALGFYGAANDATRAAARKIYADEKAPVQRALYARTLALLGDPAVLADIAQAVKPADRTASIVAADALNALFGRSFGLTANTAIGPRRKAAGELLVWWYGLDAPALQVNRAEAIERLLTTPSQRLDPPRSTRDLLRRSADKTDLTDERGSHTAWELLGAMKPDDLLRQLDPIVSNADEDLDIRLEAIRWYVRAKGGPEKARSGLKSLRKDPNPEVVEIVKSLGE